MSSSTEAESSACKWTYLRQDEESAYIKGEEDKLPPKGSAFMAFDTFRWKVQVGIRESGGTMSLMSPSINDDCNIVAWAPFGVAEPPDEEMVREHTFPTWHEAINRNYAAAGLKLVLGWPEKIP